MKILEYIGVALAVIAYLLIVTGNLLEGFCLGGIASTLLAIYFLQIKSHASAGLQSFFICANMFGIFNL